MQPSGRDWILANARRYRLIAGFLAALVCWPLSGLSEPARGLPGDVVIPAYTPGSIGFRPGDRLRYRVTWSGLPVAFADIVLRLNPGHPGEWTGEVLISTNRLVDIFYRMRADLDDEFAARDLLSRSVTIRQRENQRESEYSIRFERTQGLVEAVRRTHDKLQMQRYAARHPVGPVSGALLALSQSLAVGDELTFDCFAGTSRYVFAFDVKDRELLATAEGDTVPVLRIEPRLIFLSAGKEHYRAERVVVYVAEDSRHTPLRIVADTFVGRIYADLVSTGHSPGAFADQQ